MAKEFSSEFIYYLNNKYPWNGSINMPHLKEKKNYNYKNDNNKYQLHATGYCDITNGRTYVSLPSNLKITNEVRRQYNLI